MRHCSDGCTCTVNIDTGAIVDRESNCWWHGLKHWCRLCGFADWIDLHEHLPLRDRVGMNVNRHSLLPDDPNFGK